MGISLGHTDVIIKPLLTEKTNMLIDQGKYTFKVNKLSTKQHIKNAIENIYNVKVEQVYVMNMKPKPKRRGAIQGKTSSWKKAIVKLVKGYSINELENLH